MLTLELDKLAVIEMVKQGYSQKDAEALVAKKRLLQDETDAVKANTEAKKANAEAAAANQAAMVEFLATAAKNRDKFVESTTPVMELLAQKYAANMSTFEQMAEQSVMNVEGLFSDVLYAGITGNLDDIQDAFKNFWKGMLRQIMNFLAQQAVLKLLKSLSGMGGGWGSFFGGMATAINGKAAGGVYEGGFRAFANGGVVSDPTLGLVGEGRFDEAVIPLPNRGSVPVELHGGDKKQDSIINQRIVLSSDLITQMKSSPDEIITIITSDILRGGETRKAIRSRS